MDSRVLVLNQDFSPLMVCSVERAFVLVPLKDIAPDLTINGDSLGAMLAKLDASDVVPIEA